MKRAWAAAVVVACGGSTPAATAPSVAGVSELDAGAPADIASTNATPTPTASATPTPTATPDATATPTPPADATPAAASDDAPSNDAAGVVYLESVQVYFKQQRDPLTKACWLHAKSTEHAYAGKAVIRVGPGGKVLSSKTVGTDDIASMCIDKQIKKWKLPPPNGTATVNLPIRLRRD